VKPGNSQCNQLHPRDPLSGPTDGWDKLGATSALLTFVIVVE
jgi:hypothetical protein